MSLRTGEAANSECLVAHCAKATDNSEKGQIWSLGSNYCSLFSMSSSLARTYMPGRNSFCTVFTCA